ncbi:MAG TPA: hypothetical protein VKM72_17140 [Thermoanaerobaculia bacterium]|nr:hypothetical protein [Thermoanaerobaculia bacterium]
MKQPLRCFEPATWSSFCCQVDDDEDDRDLSIVTQILRDEATGEEKLRKEPDPDPFPWNKLFRMRLRHQPWTPGARRLRDLYRPRRGSHPLRRRCVAAKPRAGAAAPEPGPSAGNDLDRFAELRGKAERTAEEETELARLSERLGQSLRSGERPFEQAVEAAVDKTLREMNTSADPELLDLETKRQLRELFRPSPAQRVPFLPSSPLLD